MNADADVDRFFAGDSPLAIEFRELGFHAQAGHDGAFFGVLGVVRALDGALGQHEPAAVTVAPPPGGVTGDPLADGTGRPAP